MEKKLRHVSPCLKEKWEDISPLPLLRPLSLDNSMLSKPLPASLPGMFPANTQLFCRGDTAAQPLPIVSIQTQVGASVG
jgi:hypothetical protein